MSITADVRKERRGRGGENAAGVLLDRREKSYHDFLIGNKTNETNPGGVLRPAESTCGFPITDELNARSSSCSRVDPPHDSPQEIKPVGDLRL